jgi:hypothetical protein
MGHMAKFRIQSAVHWRLWVASAAGYVVSTALLALSGAGVPLVVFSLVVTVLSAFRAWVGYAESHY